MPAPRALQLAIANSILAPNIHSDDASALALIRERDIESTSTVWSDSTTDWSRFDAVLIRSTWDYHERYDEFLAWLARLEQLGVPTINPIPLLRWNSDKIYLRQLQELGINTVPTEIVSTDELPAALHSLQGQEVVIKPTISGNAWLTMRGRAGSAEFAESLAALRRDRLYLLQPFIPEITRDGEWSLLFFDGHYSHAVRKRPAEGDFRVQNDFGGSVAVLEPDARTLAAARHALAAVVALGFSQPAYARIDGVRRDGRFLIMEVEVIEPSLFLVGAPGASERFANAIERSLRTLA